MAPKRVMVERGSRRAEPKGFFGSTYATLTSPDNQAMVRSIGVFAAAVTFLSSSWAPEWLVPA